MLLLPGLKNHCVSSSLWNLPLPDLSIHSSFHKSAWLQDSLKHLALFFPRVPGWEFCPEALNLLRSALLFSSEHKGTKYVTKSCTAFQFSAVMQQLSAPPQMFALLNAWYTNLDFKHFFLYFCIAQHLEGYKHINLAMGRSCEVVQMRSLVRSTSSFFNVMLH